MYNWFIFMYQNATTFDMKLLAENAETISALGRLTNKLTVLDRLMHDPTDIQNSTFTFRYG
jgi:hypothetical protein